MNLMSLDLEMNQPSGKIIQVGYSIWDTVKDEIIPYPSRYIAIDEELDERIIKLCHINVDKYHKEKINLHHAYEEMAEYYKMHECKLNVITWGGGDTQYLREQLNMQDKRWVFGRRWIDTKTIAQTYFVANGISFPGGLAKSMLKLGLKFKGTKHDAADDAYNTLVTYRHLFNKLKEIK